MVFWGSSGVYAQGQQIEGEVDKVRFVVRFKQDVNLDPGDHQGVPVIGEKREITGKPEAYEWESVGAEFDESLRR